jgi:tRNA uridine 5-carboxymethylaminomethyl modification enzyme
MDPKRDFDALVIGGGHAGIEASRVLAQMGLRTCLVSFDVKKTGAMSCNPAIGGVAKSHLVYEVDALGGWMGAVADQNGIQARRLNLNKGPAVRSTRVQCDKDRYAQTMSRWVANFPNLTLVQGEAAQVLYEETSHGPRVRGLRMRDGAEFSVRAVIVTAGTFMRGIMFCGDERSEGGRVGDSAAELLSDSLTEVGHGLSRLKTGTPARLDARTLNFSGLERQWGDPEKRLFSWRNPAHRLPQLSCFLTYTSERTHEVIRANFARSPLFSGDIQGVGPRYCPSVEDKIKRFPDRERHQIFLEPEGLDTHSIYPNGLSTSLPADVQLEFLRTIPGLESAELLRPGYAVEYDTIDPTSLLPSFMSKHAQGLFLAGQVNRTSGYEEAASQGLWAGLQASLYLYCRESLQPDRSRSYLETLVDDLTGVGTQEPYRMFTSRSEYRLLLREDNAHDRLHDFGRSLGLLSDEQCRWHDAMQRRTGDGLIALQRERKRLSVDRVISYYDYLRRPEVSWEQVAAEADLALDDIVFERLEVRAKYEGYLQRQEEEVVELRKMRAWILDPLVDVSSLAGLSREVVEKYEKFKPANVYELGRISGIPPTAVLSIAKLAGRKEIVSRETKPPG